MIARSRLVFASVILASSALHLGAMTLIWSAPSVRMEGGAQVAETSLGSSFADLAEGVQQPMETVQEVTQPESPATVAPNKPSGELTSKPSPQTARTPIATAAPPADAPAVIAASPAADRITAEPVSAPSPQATSPAETVDEPVTAETIVAAIEIAPTTSLRPKMRVKRPSPQQAKPAPTPAKPKGNANQNATAGAQSGHAAKPSQSRQASKAATRNAEGNAAASNYPGQVMRRLSRVPRPRSSARGVAVVQFTIAGNGRLATASIARSSGSAALDRAALAMVRKAQPFPSPPTGARRDYTINIKGK